MAYTKNPQHIYLSEGRWRIVCRDGSTMYWYRAVMEAHLGRPVLTSEHVHHINHDTTDDRIENLAVLYIADHGALHWPESSVARRANWKHEWSRNEPHCRACNTVERPHFATGLCQRCYQKGYMRARRAEGVTA